jgi:hypothetical protein
MNTFELLKKRLVELGLIEPDVLEAAEKKLTPFDGGLILKLTKDGLLSHDDFLKSLGPEYAIPNFTEDSAQKISPQLISKIPPDVATEFFALPIDFSEGVLTVGLPNPTDPKVIEELKFFLGYEINPVGINFLSLAKGLETHYGLKISNLALFKKPEKAPEVVQPPKVEIEIPEKQITISPPVPEQKATAAPVHIQIPKIEEKAPPRTPEIEKTIKDYATKLQTPEKPEVIKEILLEFASRYFDRAVIFVIGRGQMICWAGRGQGVVNENLKTINVPLNQPSIIERVYHTHSFYSGPMPEGEINLDILQKLGGLVPKEILLIPISAYNKVVGILYADDLKKKEQQPDLMPLHSLCQFASQGFERLLALQKKTPETV